MNLGEVVWEDVNYIELAQYHVDWWAFMFTLARVRVSSTEIYSESNSNKNICFTVTGFQATNCFILFCVNLLQPIHIVDTGMNTDTNDVSVFKCQFVWNYVL